MRKKILLSLLLFFVILVTAAIIYAPTYIKDYLNENGKELIGRKVSLTDLSLNIFNGEAKITEFEMLEDDDATIFVSFDTLFVDINIGVLFKRQLYIQEIKLDQPYVSIYSQENKFNFQSLSESDSTAVDSTNSSSEAPLKKYILENLQIISGEINYVNYDENIKHDIEDFSLLLPHIEWGEGDTDVDLEFNIASGGNFKTDINYQTENGNFNWNIYINKFNLHNLFPYTKSSVELSDLQGDFFAALNIKGNINKPAEPVIKGEVGVDNFYIIDKEDLKVVSLGHAKIKTNTIDIKEMTFPIDSIYLNDANISVEIYKKLTNFDRLIVEAKKDSITTESKPDTIKPTDVKPIKWNINSFLVENTKLNYIDFSNKSGTFQYNITDIRIKADSIAFGNKVKIDFSTTAPNGGKINVNALTNLKSTEDIYFDSNIEIKELNIKNFFIYTKPVIELSNLQGKLFADLNIKGNINNPTEPIIKGDVGVKNFYMTDKQKLRFVTLGYAKVKTNTIKLKEMNFPIESIYLNRANITLEIYEKLTNIDRLFIEKAQEASQSLSGSTKTDEGETVKWNINKLLIENSRFDFKDNSLKPEKFSYYIEDIKFKADNIAFGHEVTLKFSSKTPKGGKISADITTDPGNAKDGDFNIYLENLDAKSFTPYSLDYLAYPIESGKINLSITNNIEDNYIKSKMEINAYNTRVGSKRKDLEPKSDVPLKMALAVVRDKDDMISFDIPMEGDVNDPDFSYGKAIYRVFTITLVKVALSPFKLLSKDMGVDEEELKTINYNDLQNKLNATQINQLNIIARILKDKNPLKAEAQLYVNEENEKEKLIINRAKSHYYMKKTYKNDTLFSKLSEQEYATINAIDINDERFNKYLYKKLDLPKDSLNNNNMCKLLINDTISNNLYIDLNKTRIENLENYVTKSDSINFDVLPSYIENEEAENPYFELKYSMEE